jgi:hypothetical protein
LDISKITDTDGGFLYISKITDTDGGFLYISKIKDTDGGFLYISKIKDTDGGFLYISKIKGTDGGFLSTAGRLGGNYRYISLRNETVWLTPSLSARSKLSSEQFLYFIKYHEKVAHLHSLIRAIKISPVSPDLLFIPLRI